MLKQKYGKQPKQNANESKMNKEILKANSQIGMMYVHLSWILHV